MKQTERDYDNTEKLAGQAGAGQGKGQKSAADKPQSWRQYIEETEAAEKKAEREAAKERAAQIKKEKHSVSAWKDKARAALARMKESRTEQEAVKEKAGQAAKAVAAAAAGGWKRVRELTAGGRGSAGEALAKVRAVVDRHPISPLMYVTLLVLIVGAGFFRSTYTRAYAVNVNGQPVGVVSSEEEVQAIISNVESRATDILGERYDYDGEVSIDEVYATPADLSDAAQVEDILFDNVGAVIQAYTLVVDGVEIGRARSEADLYNLLDEAAQPYLSPDTVSYEFVEKVEVLPVEVPANTEFDLNAIREVLARFEVEQATYVVKKGDTFNAIAYSLDMWPYELSVLNPDVIVDKIWVDQELVIQEAVPFLSVQNFTDETYEETVPSPVEYIETADLYVGETKVKEQGEDGLQRVNARVTYVNGVEVEREVLSTETLVEATTTYSYTGTTPRPVTASNGYFIWPVRGTITSNFGGRNLWGRYDFHLGLDIACRTGTSIKAADGGTVIKAGWSGSYGYLVAIRHDNGYVTYYAHNSSLLVSVGQKVYQGQIIAKSGATGNVSGPHCHFEVRINGTSVNPRNYLP